jgi:uracil-DNA glycosylase
MVMNRTPPTHPAQARLSELLDHVRAYVEYQGSTGLEALPRRQPAATPAAAPAPPNPPPLPPAEPPASAYTVSAPRPDPPAPAAAAAASGNLFAAPGVQRTTTLEELRTELGDCQRCKLFRGRTHIVFGVGNPHAQLMFVGEGPGRDEDLKAEPFVGRAGQLLTEIISKGMKMRREDVYIANVIKCRPPENRNPEPDEIAACQPFLLRQIELIRPKVLVALGTFAAQTLLGLRVPISRLRGHWYDYHGIKLMPTLHPAYLLRNPNDKRLVWEDIKMVLRELEPST